MSPDNIWIIKVILGCLSGLFGVLAAVLTFFETAQNEKYEDTRAWFGAKWEAINRSRWLTLPEQAIQWFVQASKKDLMEILGRFISAWMLQSISVFVVIFMVFASLYYWGVYGAILIVILSPPIIIEAGANGYFEVKLLGERLSRLYLGFSVLVVFGGAVIVWTYLLLGLSVYYAAVIMLVLFPVYWLATFTPLFVMEEFGITPNDKLRDKLVLFILGVAVGFTVTFVALLVGHVADPPAHIPQTFQLLVSNIIFDGLTMVVTLAILSWAVGRGWLLSIPLAVLLDLLAAAVLACCSLYFALVGTEHALSVLEVLNVLVGHSPDGSRVELSPYFWTMHTTFLPTLAYLALILVTWFAKLILTPVRWFFGKGHEHKSPLKLTAALCTTIAVIFALFSVGANSVYERVKEKAAAAAAAPPAAAK